MLEFISYRWSEIPTIEKKKKKTVMLELVKENNEERKRKMRIKERRDG